MVECRGRGPMVRDREVNGIMIHGVKDSYINIFKMPVLP